MTDAAPPFAVGDRVYQPGHPEIGAMIVVACALDGDAGWDVTAQDDGAGWPGLAPWQTTADAAYFRPAPSDWIDPPLPPAMTDCIAATQLAFILWRERKDRWLDWFRGLPGD